jgi:hypothetical protein
VFGNTGIPAQGPLGKREVVNSKVLAHREDETPTKIQAFGKWQPDAALVSQAENGREAVLHEAL